jgi:hypothetical protein
MAQQDLTTKLLYGVQLVPGIFMSTISTMARTVYQQRFAQQLKNDEPITA